MPFSTMIVSLPMRENSFRKCFPQTMPMIQEWFRAENVCSVQLEEFSAMVSVHDIYKPRALLH